MYKKDTKSWFKHLDFILLDMLCLQVAFILAYAISGYGWNPYHVLLYRNIAICIELVNIIVLFSFYTLKNVLKRGYYIEFIITVKHTFIVSMLTLLYLFALQQAQAYSRLAFVLNFIIYAILTYIVRVLWKRRIQRKMEAGDNENLLIVTTSDAAIRVVNNIKNHNYARYIVAGLILIDRDLTGKEIAGVPVVANVENAAEYVCQQWIDEVLVIPSMAVEYPKQLIEKLIETGVTVHQNLEKITDFSGKTQFVEKVGDYTVLTTSINTATKRQLLAKRLIDIAGGLAGCLITVVLTIIIGPIIYIASPGPIFFAQERVGKNGKKFKMYKFRSMYMDAEERKVELMAQNKMSDSRMFKLDFDPRVIGNKILPDGTHKTGIGEFIRATSIDEFPQFFNVLKGDSGIIGTTKKNNGLTKIIPELVSNVIYDGKVTHLAYQK